LPVCTVNCVQTLKVLVYGKKRWFVAPPRHGTYSKEHIKSWLKDRTEATGSPALGADNGGVIECMQLPVVFCVPASAVCLWDITRLG
jgi:hypothetical protein